MTIIGLVCEYNPFHNGHLYHIHEIKKRYPDSLLILCLNGYFLERGEISILSKEAKTKIALTYGIDLVIELPTFYGCQAADKFAEASMILLSSLGVEKVIFGSESNQIEFLYEIAQKQVQMDQNLVKEELKTGRSYPKSLLEALKEEKIAPNDLLGISYCKAVLKRNLPMQLETIQRTSDFHDTVSTMPIVSAANIREKLKRKEAITLFVPPFVPEAILSISYVTYFQILKAKILTDPTLNQYLDVTEGIEYLLRKEIRTCTTLEEFLKRIKSKRYTFNRLQRMLLHIYLGLYKKDCDRTPDYVHILGFNEKGKRYLRMNRKTFSLPTTPIKDSFLYQFELKASQLYDLVSGQSTYFYEKRNQPISTQTAVFSNESSQK